MWIISVICVGMLAILLALGESTLVLFDGDRARAARATLAAITLLAGTAFGFLQPVIWTTFTRVLQNLIRAGRSQSRLAILALEPHQILRVRYFAIALCAFFTAAGAGLAWHFWIGGL